MKAASPSTSGSSRIREMKYVLLSFVLILVSVVASSNQDDNSNGQERKLKSRRTKRIKFQAVSGLQLKSGYPSLEKQREYIEDLEKIDWVAVEKDLTDLMTMSTSYWPADYGNYGPLFIRLAWHACGSYRTSDGRGGCDGGGIRMDPEQSWPDNQNLDKARRLLQDLKLKYGNGLSWGDLYALVGSIAIKSMGGPHIGFCPGRLDYIDNTQTIQLGPSDEQEKFAPCPMDGNCSFPLGPNTLGLIYVNPAGPMGAPDVMGAAKTVREVFGRMDWVGRELVALIGGGHAFGKTHGASQNDSGVPPNECPFNSWAGPSGAGTITSGFEGPWTTQPTKWTNEYFVNLATQDWKLHTGPGGKPQWRVKGGGLMAPSAHGMGSQEIMMLTTDIAMKEDPEYSQYVTEFANNLTALTEAFGLAWYKLVTRDMGPVTRCAGKPPKGLAFQHDLPKPPKNFANFSMVKDDLEKLLDTENMDEEYIRLAYQCASTYRATDYRGGCNGARIRFSPGIDWPINAGLDAVIATLQDIKDKYGNGLSYADLIVLAGTVAADRALGVGAPTLKFCPGRTDAMDGSAWVGISYNIEDTPKSVNQIMELIDRRGQSHEDYVALSFTHYKSANNLFNMLKNETTTSDDISMQAIQHVNELRYWGEYFATNPREYREAFAEAWTRLMNADRFDGPVANLC